MTTVASSYMPTNGAKVTRNSDVLYFPYTARPQAMTVYVRFRQTGNNGGSDMGIFHLGSSSPTADPRLAIAGNTSGGYRVVFDNGTNARTSTVASFPSVGDIVELRVTLTAGGVVQLHQTTNAGSESSGSAATANSMPAAWAGERFYVGSIAAGSVGQIEVLHVAVATGVRGRNEMRRLAGVA